MAALQKFLKARHGSAAIEFALVAPLFFVLIFGIIEICLLLLFSSIVIEGAEAGTAYMRKERLAGRMFTDSGLRAAVCASISSGGLSCDPGKLKVAPFYAGVPSGNGFGVPNIIENASDPRGGSGGQYILAVGYYWGVVLPTSKLLLRQGSGGSQIQARTYTVLKERVFDNGASL